MSALPPFPSGQISGIGTVGPYAGTGVKSVTVPFQNTFATPPVVVACALQGTDYSGVDIPDTFAVTITSVSTTQFTANVYRVDAAGVGWGQDLQLGWTVTLPVW